MRPSHPEPWGPKQAKIGRTVMSKQPAWPKTLQIGVLLPPPNQYREGNLKDRLAASSRRRPPASGLRALEEPVHGGLTRAEDRNVAVVRTQPKLCRADLTREPPAVRLRRDTILAALHDQDRRGN